MKKIVLSLLIGLSLGSNLFAGPTTTMSYSCSGSTCTYDITGMTFTCIINGSNADDVVAVRKIDGVKFDLKRDGSKEVLTLLKKLNYSDNVDLTLPFVKWCVDKFYWLQTTNGDVLKAHYMVIEELTNISVNNPKRFNELSQMFLDDIYNKRWRFNY